MEEGEKEFTQPPRPPGEGIRIIGAEEAAAAIEKGEAEGRKPSDAPRFGDVPPPPPGPRPAIRFPLDEDEADQLTRPTGVGGTRVDPFRPVSAFGAGAEPPVASARPPESGAAGSGPVGSGPVGSGPVGSGAVGSGPDLPSHSDDAGSGADDRPADAPTVIVHGGDAPELPHWTEPATGEVPVILPGTEPPEPEEEAAWSGFTRAPRWRDQGWDDAEFGDASVLADEETRLGALDTSRTEHSDLFSFEDELEEPPPAAPTRIRTRRDPAPVADAAHGGRDNGIAIAIGVGLGLLFLLLAKAGPRFLLVYCGAAVLLCTVEIFSVLRRAGYKPATLLGIVATLSLYAGAYAKGERAFPLVAVLVLVFALLWFLAGVTPGRPTINIAVTLLAFGWAGFLGSFAALILRPGNYPGHPRDGVALLFGCVLCVVANDVAAYAIGRSFGRTPLAAVVSPNKTLEGYLGAFLVTVLIGAGIVSRMHPFSVAKGFWLAVVISIVGPLGDLCESLVKRDIGLKDMGSVLPGHGGGFDRFDAMLFALPATYYFAQLVHFGR